MTNNDWKVFFSYLRYVLSLSVYLTGSSAMFEWLVHRTAGASFNGDTVIFFGPVFGLSLLAYMRSRGEV